MGTSREILPPMPWPLLGQLSDDDLNAIWVYLVNGPRDLSFSAFRCDLFISGEEDVWAKGIMALRRWTVQRAVRRGSMHQPSLPSISTNRLQSDVWRQYDVIRETNPAVHTYHLGRRPHIAPTAIMVYGDCACAGTATNTTTRSNVTRTVTSPL